MDHEFFMREALYLANRARFSSTPNPSVGCVIVKHGEIIGRGAHEYAGDAHAEVIAIASCAERPEGATAYVTLEPCNHSGRTGPCTRALIEAGIETVVYALDDPNPAVAGGGAAALRDAGVSVMGHMLESEAKWVHRGYLKRVAQGRPYVRLKMGSSMDGRSALSNGQSQWITGYSSRQDVQQLRAESCAVLSGVGTVLADDPSLNVRLPAPCNAKAPMRQPLRVITDAKGRLDGSQKLFGLDGAIRIYSALADYPLQGPSLTSVCSVPSEQGRLDLDWVLADLAMQAEVNLLHIEAGGKLAGGFLQAGLIDEIVMYIAPKIMGDEAYPLFRLPSASAMDEVVSWRLQACDRFGDDLKITYIRGD